MHPCVLKFPALCYPESLVGVGFYRAVAFRSAGAGNSRIVPVL